MTEQLNNEIMVIHNQQTQQKLMGSGCCWRFLKQDKTPFKGIILNQSDFTIEYILNGKQDKIKAKGKEHMIYVTHAKFSIQDVRLQRFFKESYQQTKLIQSHTPIYQVQPGEYAIKGLQNLISRMKRITVRVRIGQFVKIIASNAVINHEKEACLKIRKNLSVKCMQKAEAQLVFNRSLIKSTIRTFKEVKQLYPVKGPIQQQALTLLNQAYQKQEKLHHKQSPTLKQLSKCTILGETSVSNGSSLSFTQPASVNQTQIMLEVKNQDDKNKNEEVVIQC